VTELEAYEVVSILTGCYLVGWSAGYFIHIVKVFLEKI